MEAIKVTESQNVSVMTSLQFASFLFAVPVNNVVLRDKRADRYILLKRVQLYCEKEIPTKNELLNAWKAMFFNTWKMKFEIEKHGKVGERNDVGLRHGNLFRNLDRFDVIMYSGSVKVFDTAEYNLDLIEGKVGLTPKSKVAEDFTTGKALKEHCYKVATSAWNLLDIDSLVSRSLKEADEEPKKEVAKQAEKETPKAKKTSKTSKKSPKSKSKDKEVVAQQLEQIAKEVAEETEKAEKEELATVA